jgi:hypothetical protein
VSRPDLAVECHSGHTYAGEPRAVVWQGQRYEVESVVARWRLPQGPAFRVLAGEGVVFDLDYNEEEDRWTIRRREERS